MYASENDLMCCPFCGRAFYPRKPADSNSQPRDISSASEIQDRNSHTASSSMPSNQSEVDRERDA
jgi:hypothetical protein